MTDEPGLDSVLARALEGRRTDGAHPAVEALLAYHEQSLPEPEAERLRDHLAECPACAEVIRDLALFPDVEPPAGRRAPGDLERHRAWRRLERRLREEPARPRAAEAPRRTGALPWAVAALFLLAAVTLGLWGLGRQAPPPPGEPRTGMPVVELLPTAPLERGATGGEWATVPPGTASVLFLLETGELRPFPEHRLRLVTEDGRELWSRAGVEPWAPGRFAVELPRSLLEPGQHQLLLEGLRDGEAEPLGAYRFRVEAGGGASPIRSEP